MQKRWYDLQSLNYLLPGSLHMSFYVCQSSTGFSNIMSTFTRVNNSWLILRRYPQACEACQGPQHSALKYLLPLQRVYGIQIFSHSGFDDCISWMAKHALSSKCSSIQAQRPKADSGPTWSGVAQVPTHSFLTRACPPGADPLPGP